MSNDTILVLGATGKTGRRLLPRLRLLGVPVRAASRSSGTRFDWSAPDTWDDALADVGAIYLVAPPWPGPAADFLTRAEAAGVHRVTVLSGRGADLWGESAFGLDMRSAEAAARSSSLEWTILRPNNFAQNFDEDLFLAPLRAGELLLPAGDVPEPFIDVEDVADIAARVLTEPGHAGKVYELSGPEPMTFAAATELISRATGLPIAYKQVTTDEYVARLVESGTDEQTAEHVAAMFTLMADGGIADTTDGVAAVLGREPRGFTEYVTRAAAAGAWDR
ncbi:MAG: NAD(P)H-binding protein [Mycolicibacterium neoaurum]|uniref:NmrA family NAD(P)-binding protein n=1 Tax=Mycolicibacterium neoaurum TaxID=1795 RepID=UPI002FF92FC8